jgi:hypothetical protein
MASAFDSAGNDGGWTKVDVDGRTVDDATLRRVVSVVGVTGTELAWYPFCCIKNLATN